MNLYVVGIALLAWGLFMYKNSNNADAFKTFQNDYTNFWWSYVAYMSDDQETVKKYSTYTIGAGAVALLLAYLHSQKLAREAAAALASKSKTFFF